MPLMWKCTVCSVTPEGSTLTLLRLSPDDSGTYTCLALSPAGQESKIYTLFVLGQFEHFIFSSLFVSVLSFWLIGSDLTRHSPTINLWRDHCPQRTAGHTGQCCDSGVSGSRKPPSSDQLAEEWTSSPSLSSYTPLIWWLQAEVSFENIQAHWFGKILHVYMWGNAKCSPFFMKKDFSCAAVWLWSLHMLGTQSSWSCRAQLWCPGPRYHHHKPPPVFPQDRYVAFLGLWVSYRACTFQCPQVWIMLNQ